ncbi:MAG: PDZ domain-containing protein, partial [Vicinamibacterales bacterium]
MEHPAPARPRISRETRLLLFTILISMAALWALARLRFPERPATPNPVPPFLTQLAAPPSFGDLASEISTLEPQLLPSLAIVELPALPLAVVLRVRDDVGATLLATPSGSIGAERSVLPTLVAHDPASRLALMKIPGAPAPELTPWSPDRIDRPRFMVASDVSGQGASLRPVFVGRLHPATDPAWPGEIWVLPARTGVAPGDFLFTIDGALAGLVIPHAGTLALVPGDTVLRTAEHLLGQKTAEAGWLGVEVQALTPRLASATGARAGVIVSSVHPQGPAAARLAVTDVIETAGGAPMASPDEWRVRVARLMPGESIVFRVRRRGETVDVSVMAATPPAPGSPLTLGLTMQTLSRAGA